MSVLEVYKPGQARLARTGLFLAGEFLIAWGSRSLLQTVPRLWATLGLALNELPWFGDVEPEKAWWVNLVVVREKVSPALVLGVALLVVASLAWYRLLNKPRWTDLLIEMEAELRKVSWPTPSDAWQSTLVVTGFTALVVVTILFYDILIKGFLELFVRAPA